MYSANALENILVNDILRGHFFVEGRFGDGDAIDEGDLVSVPWMPCIWMIPIHTMWMWIQMMVTWHSNHRLLLLLVLWSTNIRRLKVVLRVRSVEFRVDVARVSMVVVVLVLH